MDTPDLDGSSSLQDGSTDPATRKRIAKVHKKNTRGETSLHVAARKGETETCAQLLRDAVEPNWVNLPDYAGWTALHEACYQSRYETAEMLIRSGANVNQASNEELTTPLHDAAQAGDNAIVWLLLNYGADRNAHDSKGQRPIDLCESGSRVASLLTSAELPSECPSECPSPQQAIEDKPIQGVIEASNLELLTEPTSLSNLPPLGISTCTEDATSFHSPGVGELLSSVPFVVPEALTSLVNATLPPIIPNIEQPEEPRVELPKVEDARSRIEGGLQESMDFDDEDENRLLIEDEEEEEEGEGGGGGRDGEGDGGGEGEGGGGGDGDGDGGGGEGDGEGEGDGDGDGDGDGEDQEIQKVQKGEVGINGDEGRQRENDDQVEISGTPDTDPPLRIDEESPEAMEIDSVLLGKRGKVGRPKSSRTSTPIPTNHGLRDPNSDRKRGPGRGRKRGARATGRGGSCTSSPRASRFSEQDIYEFKDSPDSGNEQGEELPERESSAPPSWKRMRIDEDASRSGDSNGSASSPLQSNGQQVPVLRISLKGGSDDETMDNDSQSTSSRGGKGSSRGKSLSLSSAKKPGAPPTREGTPLGQTDDDGQSRMTRSRIRQSGKTIEEPDYWGKGGKKLKRTLAEGEGGEKEEEMGDEIGEQDEEERDGEKEKEDYIEAQYDIEQIALKETNIAQRIMLYDSTKSRLELQKQLISRWIEDSSLDTASTMAAENTMPPNYPQYMIATRDYFTDIDWYREMIEKEPLLATIPKELREFWDSQQKKREHILQRASYDLARQQMLYEREYVRHYRRSICGPNRLNLCRMLRELETYNSMTLLQPGHPEDEAVLRKEDFTKTMESPIQEMWRRHCIEAVALATSQRSHFSIEARALGLTLETRVLEKLCPEIPTRRLEMYL
ncbi:unnamed protein product, partial [Mesorhabditis belari]|uniref:Uncharacterized protein n=1 Tax=Mesorhabditis belari TaxID=2138241 RepID=A0AAF3J2W8_9BILA